MYTFSSLNLFIYSMGYYFYLNFRVMIFFNCAKERSTFSVPEVGLSDYKQEKTLNFPKP